MCYDQCHYEKTSVRPSTDGRRASALGVCPPLVRCFCPPPLPDHPGQLTRPVGSRDRPQPRLRRPDRPQYHRRLQRVWPRLPGQGVLGPTHYLPRPARRTDRATPGALAPEPAELRQTDQSVDLAACRRNQLRPGHHRRSSHRRDDSRHASSTRHPLATSQAVDHQSRPRVRPKKVLATD